MSSKDIEPKIRVEDIEHEGRIEMGEWGLTIKQELTFKDWLDAVIGLQKFDGKIQWYLGDLAVFAEADIRGWDTKDKKDKDSKSKYEKLVESTGYEVQTMRTFASVARRFPEQFRINVLSQDNTSTLSWSHFKAVAPLDDNFAVYFLIKASEQGWGKDKLRDEIRKWKIERGEIDEPREEPVSFRTFKEQDKKAWKDYTPMARDNFEYDETSYWLEIRDYANEQLHRLGIVDTH